MASDRNDNLPDDDQPDDGTGRGSAGVAEMVRKALLAGVGAVFMTEEQIRKSVQDLKLPKEALGYIAGQADKTRTEASRILRVELRRFLNSEAFRQQLLQMLGSVTLEVKAEVRIKPGLPEVTNARVRVKSSPKDE
jgi:hypothetical protein